MIIYLHSVQMVFEKTPPSIWSKNSSNLIVMNCLPMVKDFKHPLSFCLMNTQSMTNKSADIFNFVCEHKIDLLAITKTWLNVNDDAVRNELPLTNYKLCDHPCTDRTSGGTALLPWDSLHVKKMNDDVLLYHSAAFYIIDHSILLNKLSSTWFEWHCPWLVLILFVWLLPVSLSAESCIWWVWPVAWCSSRFMPWPTSLYSSCKHTVQCHGKAPPNCSLLLPKTHS